MRRHEVERGLTAVEGLATCTCACAVARLDEETWNNATKGLYQEHWEGKEWMDKTGEKSPRRSTLCPQLLSELFSSQDVRRVVPSIARARKLRHVLGVSWGRKLSWRQAGQPPVLRTFDQSSMSMSPAVVLRITRPWVGRAIGD